jgi:hypothetical protein
MTTTDSTSALTVRPARGLVALSTVAAAEAVRGDAYCA